MSLHLWANNGAVNNGVCVFALTSLVLGGWIDRQSPAATVAKIAGVAAIVTILTDTFFF